MYYLIYDPSDPTYIVVNPEHNKSSYDWCTSISKCFNLVSDDTDTWIYPDDQSEAGMREWIENDQYWEFIRVYDELPTKQSHPELFI